MIDQAIVDRWYAEWQVTEEKVSEAISRIVRAANPLKIIAFGSRARGTPHRDSDLDLAVIVDAVQPGERPVSSTILADLHLPVDLLVRSVEHHNQYKTFVTSVHHDIAEEGVVLYDRERNGRTDQTAIKKSASDEKVLQFDLISPQIRAYHAQQAIEKLLKAWIVALGIDPPKVHDLDRLAGVLQKQGQTLPITPIPLGLCSEYAADWRYNDVPQEDVLDDAEMRESVRILSEHIRAAIAQLN